MNAAGHQVVARALGRRPRENRRLDLEKIVAVEIRTRGDRHLVAQHEILLQRRAAQIEVAIPQAGLLRHGGVLLIGNGGVFASFRISSSSTTTSISPVGILALTASVERASTC